METSVDYQLLKALHFLGIIVFLGNIIVTAMWKALADSTKKPDVIAYAQRLITITDFSFTATGAALIVISGRLMVSSYGDISDVYWIAWGWWLFIISGIIWVAVLIPIQIKQVKLIRKFQPGGEIPARYWRLALWWYTFGTIATLLPLANLYFMVFKPI